MRLYLVYLRTRGIRVLDVSSQITVEEFRTICQRELNLNNRRFILYHDVFQLNHSCLTLQQYGLEANTTIVLDDTVQCPCRTIASSPLPYINIRLNGVRGRALLDSGSDCTMLSLDFVNRCDQNDQIQNRFSMDDDCDTYGEIESVYIEIENHLFTVNVLVKNDDSFDCTIGMEMMRRYGAVIDISGGFVRFETNNVRTSLLYDDGNRHWAEYMSMQQVLKIMLHLFASLFAKCVLRFARFLQDLGQRVGLFGQANETVDPSDIRSIAIIPDVEGTRDVETEHAVSEEPIERNYREYDPNDNISPERLARLMDDGRLPRPREVFAMETIDLAEDLYQPF